MTLPLIRALETLRGEHRERLAFCFREGNVASSRREIILSGALETSVREAEKALGDAASLLVPLPDSPARRALRGLAGFVAARARDCLAAG